MAIDYTGVPNKSLVHMYKDERFRGSFKEIYLFLNNLKK